MTGEKKYAIERGTYVRASARIAAMSVGDLAAWLDKLRLWGVPDDHKIMIELVTSYKDVKLVVDTSFPSKIVDGGTLTFATTTGHPLLPCIGLGRISGLPEARGLASPGLTTSTLGTCPLPCT